MPAIKKKWMKASHDDGSNISADKDAKEDIAKGDQRKDSNVSLAGGEPQRPLKRVMPQGPAILRRIDHGEVLQEKRKRFTPPAESKLMEWLDNNFEKRPDVSVKLTLMYKHYTELCQAAGSDILGVPEFNRMVKQKFGKTFGLQENSLYRTVLKERKITDKKSGGSGIKLKEIVLEAINNSGNPWHGVRFFTLKRYISSRYPALQIDMKPKLLKRSLERGMTYGQIDLVKGVGMAGYYKIPGGEPPPPKPEEKVQKEDGTAEDEKKQAEGKDENETPADEATEQVVKKKKLIKKIQPWDVSKFRSGSPRFLEDAFPLALTYQCAPKTASIQRIRRYLQEKYGETVTDNRWRQALESGVKKGYWEHISGSGIAGTLHLQMDDFNPSSSQIEDMICAAIIACHEPKSASANQIKKYISTYHSEFGVDQRPDRFKKALQRAVDKKMIMQLTGLGAAGSYQLMVPFTPSPAMLAGDDASDVEEEDPELPAYVPRGTKSRGIPKLKTMEIVRSPAKKFKAGTLKKPEPTKKGKGRNMLASSKKNKLKLGKKKLQRRNSMKNGRKRAPSPLTDEEDDSDDKIEYTPSKSKSVGRPSKKGKEENKDKSAPSQNRRNQSESPGKTTSAKSKGPSPKKVRLSKEVQDDSLGEEDEEEVTPEYTPRKSKSRGGGKEEIKPAVKTGGNKKKR